MQGASTFGAKSNEDLTCMWAFVYGFIQGWRQRPNTWLLITIFYSNSYLSNE